MRKAAIICFNFWIITGVVAVCWANAKMQAPKEKDKPLNLVIHRPVHKLSNK